MSGHNKWSSIKHKKGAADAKRGRIFTKLIKEISIAAREGGGDPDGNPRLRTAILTAKANSMPRDNIERAVKKGTGDADGGAQVEELTYEGYGPGGVAVLVEVVTDNKNRTIADIRHIFSKNNGNLGESGCVSWMFNRRGTITITGEGLTEDTLMEAVLDIEGFEDLEVGDGDFTVYTEGAKLYAVRETLTEKGFNCTEAKLAWIPQNVAKVEGKKAEQTLRLIDVLEDHDDVTNVFANFDVDEEELARIEAL